MDKNITVFGSFKSFWKNIFNYKEKATFKEFVYTILSNVIVLSVAFIIMYCLTEGWGISSKLGGAFVLVATGYLIACILPFVALLVRMTKKSNETTQKTEDTVNVENSKPLGELELFELRKKEAEGKIKDFEREIELLNIKIQRIKDFEKAKEKLHPILDKHKIVLPFPMPPSPSGYSDANKYYYQYIKPCIELFKLDNYYRDQGYTTYFVAFHKKTATPYIVGGTFSDWHVSYTSYERTKITYEVLNELAEAFGYTKYIGMNADNWMEYIAD